MSFAAIESAPALHSGPPEDRQALRTSRCLSGVTRLASRPASLLWPRYVRENRLGRRFAVLVTDDA